MYTSININILCIYGYFQTLIVTAYPLLQSLEIGMIQYYKRIASSMYGMHEELEKFPATI